MKKNNEKDLVVCESVDTCGGYALCLHNYHHSKKQHCSIGYCGIVGRDVRCVPVVKKGAAKKKEEQSIVWIVEYKYLGKWEPVSMCLTREDAREEISCYNSHKKEYRVRKYVRAEE